MPAWITGCLILLTLLALSASIVAMLRLRRVDDESRARRLGRLHAGLTLFCTVGAGLLFVYQAASQGWRPLNAHVDGLLLIATLLGAMMLYLQHRSRAPGIGAFAGPVLTLLLAWSICANTFTWHVFEIHSVWQNLHLASVYVGTLFFSIAAVAGGMYLFAQRRLRHKQLSPMSTPAGGGAGSAGGPVRRLASLETSERIIIRFSAIGFALLTLGLATGLIIVTSQAQTNLGPGWWHSPKVVLATAVWVIYAIVMNVRHATAFRGARAAWLSIAGMILLLATLAVSTAMPGLPGLPGAPTEKPEAGQSGATDSAASPRAESSVRTPQTLGFEHDRHARQVIETSGHVARTPQRAKLASLSVAPNPSDIAHRTSHIAHRLAPEVL